MCGLDMFVILTIALSSEIASYRHGLMSSYYNTANSINKSLMLSCSSNVIYGYHLTGKRAGAPIVVEWTMEWTMGCTAGGTIVF